MKTPKLFFITCSLCLTGLFFASCGHPDNPNPHMKGFPTGRMEYRMNERTMKKYTFPVVNVAVVGIKSDQMLPDNYKSGAVLYTKMK